MVAQPRSRKKTEFALSLFTRNMGQLPNLLWSGFNLFGNAENNTKASKNPQPKGTLDKRNGLEKRESQRHAKLRENALGV